MQDLRSVPNYSFAEAARCLGIPCVTLRSWFKGSTKDGRTYKPFLKMSDPARLTFFEMMQADALFLISNPTTLRTIREQLKQIDPMELVRKELFFDRRSIYRHIDKQLISLREQGQVYNKSLLEPYLKRVRYDADNVAFRIYPFLGRPGQAEVKSIPLENIVIDPKKCYGAVFHEGIGAPVQVIGTRYDLGETIGSLAKDFDTTEGFINEALRARNRIYVNQEAA